MADTNRSDADNSTLMPPGVSQGTDIQAIRDALFSGGVGGSMGQVNNSTAQGPLAAGWQVAILDQSGPSRGVTYASVDSSLTIDVAGEYMVEITLCFTGTANQNFEFGIFVNGAAPIGATQRKVSIAHANEFRCVQSRWRIVAAAGDKIQLGVRSSGNTITIETGGVLVERRTVI